VRTVNIDEAKADLSHLLRQVANGTAVVIVQTGKPIAKIVPIDAPIASKSKRLGFLEGELRVPDDFDQTGANQIESTFGA